MKIWFSPVSGEESPAQLMIGMFSIIITESAIHSIRELMQAIISANQAMVSTTTMMSLVDGQPGDFGFRNVMDGVAPRMPKSRSHRASEYILTYVELFFLVIRWTFDRIELGG